MFDLLLEDYGNLNRIESSLINKNYRSSGSNDTGKIDISNSTITNNSRIVVDRIPTLIYCCYWVLYPKLYKFFCKKTKMLFLTLLLLYSIIKIYMFFGTPIGYYENIITGAMSYQERKTFTLKETTF